VQNIPLAGRPILCNGAGRWWLRCSGPCFMDSPTWVRRDPLKLLALAQAAGWQTTRTAEGLTV
jgi:hypothetical protein